MTIQLGGPMLEDKIGGVAKRKTGQSGCGKGTPLMLSMMDIEKWWSDVLRI